MCSPNHPTMPWLHLNALCPIWAIWGQDRLVPGWGMCVRTRPCTDAAATPKFRGLSADRAGIGGTGGGLGHVCAIRTVLGYSGCTREYSESGADCAGIPAPAGRPEKSAGSQFKAGTPEYAQSGAGAVWG